MVRRKLSFHFNPHWQLSPACGSYRQNKIWSNRWKWQQWSNWQLWTHSFHTSRNVRIYSFRNQCRDKAACKQSGYYFRRSRNSYDWNWKRWNNAGAFSQICNWDKRGLEWKYFHSYSNHNEYTGIGFSQCAEGLGQCGWNNDRAYWCKRNLYPVCGWRSYYLHGNAGRYGG